MVEVSFEKETLIVSLINAQRISHTIQCHKQFFESGSILRSYDSTGPLNEIGSHRSTERRWILTDHGI